MQDSHVSFKKPSESTISLVAGNATLTVTEKEFFEKPFWVEFDKKTRKIFLTGGTKKRTLLLKVERRMPSTEIVDFLRRQVGMENQRIVQAFYSPVDKVKESETSMLVVAPGGKCLHLQRTQVFQKGAAYRAIESSLYQSMSDISKAISRSSDPLSKMILDSRTGHLEYLQKSLDPSVFSKYKVIEETKPAGVMIYYDEFSTEIDGARVDSMCSVSDLTNTEWACVDFIVEERYHSFPKMDPREHPFSIFIDKTNHGKWQIGISLLGFEKKTASGEGSPEFIGNLYPILERMVTATNKYFLKDLPEDEEMPELIDVPLEGRLTIPESDHMNNLLAFDPWFRAHFMKNLKIK